MSRLNLERKADYLSWVVGFIIAAVPFHAFITVWLASRFGHYTLLRLWEEALLVALVAGALYILSNDKLLSQKFKSWRLAQLCVIYIGISVVWGVAAYGLHYVSLKALGYGLIVNLRYLAFFLAASVIAASSPLLKQIWPKLLLAPAAIVAVFGLLQRLVLPYDFLKHFGYNASTIYPYETINHNIHYPRIMSTLRGANPLGAYLVIVISALAGLLARAKKRRWQRGVLLALTVAAMVFSYSRGAWAGVVFSVLALAWLGLKSEALRKRLLIVAAGLVIVSLGLLLGLRHNSTFQNLIFHTQQNSPAKESSNAGHALAFRNGIHDVIHQPLGRGVGTAGPASGYNTKGNQRLAENYYLQLGQELGWLGLGLFLAINYQVAKQLYAKRQDHLARILLTSFLGLVLVNLVSHAWTDNTLAYIWWGLAGIALAPAIIRGESKQNENTKT